MSARVAVPVLGCVVTLLSPFVSSPRSASAQTVPVVDASGANLRIDGSLREWRGVPLQARDGFRFAIARDTRSLIVGSVVEDDRVIRLRRSNEIDDALVVRVAVGNEEPVDLVLRPGLPGVAATMAMTRGNRTVPLEGRIVEGPRSDGRDGFELEASIALAALPFDASLRDARVAVAYRDVDQEAHPTIRWRASLDSLLPVEGAAPDSDTLRTFLTAQGLAGRTPRHDVQADVLGGGGPERIVIVGTFAVVVGPELEGYRYVSLPVERDAQVTRVAPADLDGDRKSDELVVWLARGFNARPTTLAVFDLGRTEPGLVFAAELSRADVELATATIATRRGRASIELSYARRRAEPPIPQPSLPNEIHAPLDASVASRRIAWSGTALVVTEERSRPPLVAPRQPEPDTIQAVVDAPQPAPAPRPADALLAACDAAGLSSVPATTTIDANVSGDATAERVGLFGRTIIVVGPRFLDGTGFVAHAIAVERDEDVQSLEATDVTGDGTRELLVRVAQRLGDARRTLLLVLTVQPQRIDRVFAVEVARERADGRVESVVRATGEGRARTLEIRPGPARGWTEQSYPFAPGSPGPGIEPIVLPWQSTTRFRWTGSRMDRVR